MKESLVQQVIILRQQQLKINKYSPSSFFDLELSNKELSLFFNDPAALPEKTLQTIINKLRPQPTVVIVGTANHETIQRINAEAKIKKRLVAVLGYPGAGKTLGHGYFHENHLNTYKIEATSSMRRKEFLSEILSQMGCYFEGTIFEMVATIAYELSLKDKPLIIIDEISKLGHNSLMDIHDLRNRTMGICGIVLSGCPYFKTNLEKEKNRQKQGIPELYSRVQAWYELEPPTKAEIAAICNANGVHDEATIKEFQRLRNFRELSNSILNETDKPQSV